MNRTIETEPDIRKPADRRRQPQLPVNWLIVESWWFVSSRLMMRCLSESKRLSASNFAGGDAGQRVTASNS